MHITFSLVKFFKKILSHLKVILFPFVTTLYFAKFITFPLNTIQDWLTPDLTLWHLLCQDSISARGKLVPPISLCNRTDPSHW